MKRYKLIAAGLAVAVAAGLAAIQASASPESGEPSTAGARPDATRVYVDAVTNSSLNRAIRSAEGTPTVSETRAVAAAWAQMGSVQPERVVDTYVEWNAQPVWVVSFEGGNVCTPALGPSPSEGQSTEALCLDNAQSVRIDAETGQWLDTFSDGIVLSESDLQASPEETEVDLLHG